MGCALLQEPVHICARGFEITFSLNTLSNSRLGGENGSEQAQLAQGPCEEARPLSLDTNSSTSGGYG
jgi:hypothetical protein